MLDASSSPDNGGLFALSPRPPAGRRRQREDQGKGSTNPCGEDNDEKNGLFALSPRSSRGRGTRDPDASDSGKEQTKTRQGTGSNAMGALAEVQMQVQCQDAAMLCPCCVHAVATVTWQCCFKGGNYICLQMRFKSSLALSRHRAAKNHVRSEAKSRTAAQAQEARLAAAAAAPGSSRLETAIRSAACKSDADNVDLSNPSAMDLNSKIQAAFTSQVEKTRNLELASMSNTFSSDLDMLMKQEQERSVTTIQASLRRRRSQKLVQTKREQRAAILIQTRFRGKESQKVFWQKNAEAKATLVIQSHLRKRKPQMMLRRLKAERDTATKAEIDRVKAQKLADLKARLKAEYKQNWEEKHSPRPQKKKKKKKLEAVQSRVDSGSLGPVRASGINRFRAKAKAVRAIVGFGASFASSVTQPSPQRSYADQLLEMKPKFSPRQQELLRKSAEQISSGRSRASSTAVKWRSRVKEDGKALHEKLPRLQLK